MFDSVVLNEASLPFESVEDCENNITSFLIYSITLKIIIFNFQGPMISKEVGIN